MAFGDRRSSAAVMAADTSRTYVGEYQMWGLSPSCRPTTVPPSTTAGLASSVSMALFAHVS